MDGNWPIPQVDCVNLIYDPKVYIWNPEARGGPINAIEVPVPAQGCGDPAPASEDIFCAAHSFLPNGDTITAGGRDFFTAPPCDSEPSEGECGHVIGADEAFVFRQATGTWERLTEKLARDRYYPSTVRLRDGSIAILGHAGQSTKDGLAVGPPGTRLTRDQFLYAGDGDPTDDLFAPLRENWDLTALADCVDIPPGVSVTDYPKVFLTLRDELMWVDAEFRTPGEDLHQSWFLPLEDPVCEASPEPLRWRVGVTTTHEALHAGGNAAHIIWRDATGSPRDVVYNVGGTEHGQDDKKCSDGPVTAMAEKMVDPSATASWDDEGVADLYWNRFNGNLVVLLDGSFIDVGGAGDEGGVCTPRHVPELYYPPELFGPQALDQWIQMQPAEHPRLYHSVAVLLPDGRVVSAGGQNLDEPPPGSMETPNVKHSLEIFRPPYFFRGARPEIDEATVPPTAEIGSTSGDTPENTPVEVTIHGGGVPERVALLSPTSATHAFNFDQRYVELVLAEPPVPLGDDRYELTIQWPETDLVAPPGYYMLTVIDDQGSPAPAVFIQIVPET